MGSINIFQSGPTAIKRLLSIHNKIRGMKSSRLPALVDDDLLVLRINRQGGTGAGELDDEDEEEADHRDEEEEDPRGCDASNDGKVCDDSSDFTVNSHTDDEEGDENVDNIQTHQRVFRTREAATHV